MDNEYIYDRIRADIDLDAIRENIQMQKALLKEGVKTCAVIKADGYGHGAVPIAKNVKDIVDFFAVATIDEAINLRMHNVKLPILILGYVRPENTLTAIGHDLRLCVFSLDQAKKLNHYAEDSQKKLKIHLKIDTGMSRLGFIPSDQAFDDIMQISQLKGLEIEGIFTHFYLADGPENTQAKGQLELFNGFCDRLAQAGIRPEIKHASNSAAIQKLPEANLDMVRMGISIYGLYPSEFVTDLELKPAMSLISHVSFVKKIPAGTTVGYGATFAADHEITVATIPVGYADGYPRALSNKGHVIINGVGAPIIGRICMDQFMVDATDVPDVKEGMEVILVGARGNESITVEELSELGAPFNYEFVCDISKRVPRVFYRDGKEILTKDYFYDRY